MEQKLIKEVKKLMPKITDVNASFSEEELSPIKAMYEAINNTIVWSMMSCGGKLCPSIRKSVLNYMNSIEHVSFEEPKKIEVKKSKIREELMLEAISIASKKGINKPHPKMGIKKLKEWIQIHK